jgi:hypothetical protein
VGVSAIEACGECPACLANIRYRCVKVAQARDASTPTVEVKCAKCGEAFRVFEYLVAFAKRTGASPMWCDDCRAGREESNNYDRGYR